MLSEKNNDTDYKTYFYSVHCSPDSIFYFSTLSTRCDSHHNRVLTCRCWKLVLVVEVGSCGVRVAPEDLAMEDLMGIMLITNSTGNMI